MPNGFPVVVPVKLEAGFLQAFSRIAHLKGAFLLDSGDTAARNARYSFAGADPVRTLSAVGGFVDVDGRTIIDNPTESLKRMFNFSLLSNAVDSYLPFAGGLVGFISFEWANFRGMDSANKSAIPDLYFGFYDTVITYDHIEESAWITSLGLNEDGSCDRDAAFRKIERLMRELQIPIKPSSGHLPPLNARQEIFSGLSKDKYIEGINALKKAGGLPLFARNFLSPTHKSPWEVYLALRKNAGAPFAAYINRGDYAIMSSSRTCMLKISEDNVVLNPTKGSLSSSHDKEEDVKRVDELKHDPDYQVSHRSLVSDIISGLGNISEPSSIELPTVAKVESDGKAHHIVSEINAVKHSYVDHLDCLLNLLPAFAEGRTASLISKIENSPRSVYTGTIGFIGVNKKSEFNSAFRTMILKETIGHLHSGVEVLNKTDGEEAFIKTTASAEKIFELTH